MPRTDVHSPANLVTEDYEYLFCFDNQAPGFLVNVDMEWWRSITNFTPELSDRGWHQCHHCGAHIRYVALLRHVPSGYAIAVGETCLDNRFERATAEFHALRRAAQLDRQEQRIKTAATAFLEGIEDADVHEALTKDGDLSGFVGLDDYGTSTILDIRRKLWNYGELSDRQVAFVRRLIDQGYERVQREEEQEAEAKVSAPIGRHEFEGVVVSRKGRETAYGYVVKITVKVTTPEGVWLAWLSEPKAIETERGDVVRLTATLEPSDNHYFAFGKRPSKAEIVRHADGSEPVPCGDPARHANWACGCPTEDALA